jgi:hypothetical protein
MNPRALLCPKEKPHLGHGNAIVFNAVPYVPYVPQGNGDFMREGEGYGYITYNLSRFSNVVFTPWGTGHMGHGHLLRGEIQ